MAQETRNGRLSGPDDIVVNLRPIRAEFRRLEADLVGLTQRFTATHQEIRELQERVNALVPSK